MEGNKEVTQIGEVDELMNNLFNLASEMSDNANFVFARALMIADYRDGKEEGMDLSKTSEPHNLIEKLRILRSDLQRTNGVLRNSRESLQKSIG